MNFTRQKSLLNRNDDSFIVSDSDEEEYSPIKINASTANIRVINDSDSERDTTINSESDQNLSENGSSPLDSEEEDRQFMNNSHIVSIVEHSSDTESDSSKVNEKFKKLKRKSIYDNPVNSHTPKSESTPLCNMKRKRNKRVIYSDSESENLSVDHGKESINTSGNKVLQYSIEEDDNDKQLHNDASNTQLPVKETFILEEKKISNIIKRNNVIDLTVSDDQDELQSGKKLDSIDKKINILDLNIDINHEKSNIREKSRIKNNEESNDEILICSSTSTSENEIDDEVLKFVKKEVGVGNIDPVDAQKKEHYLVQINVLENQLKKLNKFAESIAIHQLPDGGAKVHETIKNTKKQIADLQEKLLKLSRKTIMKNQRNSHLPTIKPESKKSVKSTDSYSVPSNENKDTFHENVKFNAHNFGKHDSEGNDKDDDFDILAIPDVPETSFDTKDLGKKALATFKNQQSLTVQRLEQLHGSLTSHPADDARDKDPYGLKIALMPHQQHALAWMKWREQQKPKGGILADDMGLGKTLTMISLVLASLNDKESDSGDDSSDEEWFSKKKHKRYYGGTLVVCPASLIKQWESEVNNRCKRGLLSVLVFHGNKRSVDDRKLSKYNIVITTYQTLVREAELESGMYKMEWNRVILDEAHYIRNHKSKASLVVCGLSSKYRWALSGTPIQNKEMDLYAILKFLKCSPFDDLQVWKRWVDNKNDAGKQRLVTIMKALMLRRTKQELQAKGSLESLPEKLVDIIEIEMDHDETLAYQKILLFSQNLFAQFLAQRADKQHTKELYGGKFDRPSSYGAVTQFTKAQKALLAHHSSVEAHEILVLLLRLRQMCCHPALVHAMLDKEDTEVNGILDQDHDTNSDLLQRLSNMSINDDDEVDELAANYKIDEKVATNLLTKKNPIFDEKRRSSKVRKVIETVEEILDKGEKLIIVSQWSSFLKVIARNLKNVEDAKYEFFTGEVAVKNRQDIVDKLNNSHGDTNILLLSLTAGGVGLNLVGANHLLLVDIHWNPQLEAQAQDRIYRFGQNKNVHVYKFICKETIEERVKALQDRKLDIANHVLTGTRAVSSKLTIEDLKLLFS